MFGLEKLKKLVNMICTKVGFRDLVNNQKVPSWFSAEDIADLQIQRGSNKKMLQKKCC